MAAGISTVTERLCFIPEGCIRMDMFLKISALKFKRFDPESSLLTKVRVVDSRQALFIDTFMS